jgi:hypothetical protein
MQVIAVVVMEVIAVVVMEVIAVGDDGGYYCCR